jgi:energy-coupling factor transporter transmembrane protein EcfT
LLIVFCALISMFLTHQFENLVGLFFLSLIFLFCTGLSGRFFLKIAPKVLFFAFIYFVLLVVFSNSGSTKTAGFVAFRIFATALISICSMQVISHEVCLLFLCQKRLVSNRLVYPLLFALSSVSLLKKQFDLIRINSKLRRIKGWVWPHLLFQFIVFAIRFSEKGALSLTTRHLSNEKDFYYDFSLRPRDFIVLILMSCLLCIILIARF